MDFIDKKKYEGITPEPQFSDDVHLLKINYSKEETELMDIFRGVVKSGEISPRVYELTGRVIDFFPTNYVAWVVRRQCLDQIKEIDLYDELSFIDNMIVETQKNYQIWHHRKLLIDKLNDASHEKKVLDEVFQKEEKNFHAWTHRIWMIRRFNNIEGEFEFIDNMLKKDIKNNSVWNYRFFLVLYTNGNKPTREIINKEINYALEKIKECPINECPYCYIRGYITKFKYKYGDFNEVKEVLKNMERLKINSYALSLLLDFYEEEKDEKNFNETIEILSNLDYIRKKYYLWRKNNANFK